MIHYFNKYDNETSKERALQDGTYTYKEYTFYGGKKTLAREMSYVNHALDGIQKAYYDNGCPYFEVSYKEGRKHGRATLWSHTDKNIVGQVVAIWNYEDDYRNGEYQEWYVPSNQDKCTIEFKNGAPNGFVRGFLEGGHMPYRGEIEQLPSFLFVEGDYHGAKSFFMDSGLPDRPIKHEVASGHIADARFRVLFERICSCYIRDEQYNMIFKL